MTLNTRSLGCSRPFVLDLDSAAWDQLLGLCSSRECASTKQIGSQDSRRVLYPMLQHVIHCISLLHSLFADHMGLTTSECPNSHSDVATSPQARRLMLLMNIVDKQKEIQGGQIWQHSRDWRCHGIFGQQHLRSSRDVFLMKFNTSGHWHWTRQHGSSASDNARALKSDDEGNIFLAGALISLCHDWVLPCIHRFL